MNNYTTNISLPQKRFPALLHLGLNLAKPLQDFINVSGNIFHGCQDALFGAGVLIRDKSCRAIDVLECHVKAPFAEFTAKNSLMRGGVNP